jgi:hypothetical protein
MNRRQSKFFVFFNILSWHLKPTHLLLSILLMKQSGPILAGGVLASCEIEIDRVAGVRTIIVNYCFREMIATHIDMMRAAQA